jgi:hypothetical protein
MTPSPNWNELASLFPGKTPQQIAERWEKVLNPALTKGSWTREEDETIIKYVEQHGIKDWTKLAGLLPGRIGKQCRERWRNHLDPDVNHAPWTEQEDEILINCHETIGTKWVKIAEYLPGRSDNAIKNRWNSTLSKRLECEERGIARPKRGRPSRKLMAQRPEVSMKPKSADDVPKPPRLDEIGLSGVKEPDAFCHLSAMTLTPSLLSPFRSPRSPFFGTPGFDRCSPFADFSNLFSTSNGSSKENGNESLSLMSPTLFPK